MFRDTAVNVPEPELGESLGTISDRVCAQYDRVQGASHEKRALDGNVPIKDVNTLRGAAQIVLRNTTAQRWSEVVSALPDVAAMYGLRNASESLVAKLLSRWFFAVRGGCCICLIAC